eukprot:Filipodium_phascolosomae@DN3065_c0_g1_i1.p1
MASICYSPSIRAWSKSGRSVRTVGALEVPIWKDRTRLTAAGVRGFALRLSSRMMVSFLPETPQPDSIHLKLVVQPLHRLHYLVLFVWRCRGCFEMDKHGIGVGQT